MTKILLNASLSMFMGFVLTCCVHAGEDESRDGGEAPDSCCDAGEMDSGMDGGPDADVIPPGCEGVIEFPDPVLDQAVRWEIGKSLDEDIHREDIMNLRVLRVENDCFSPEVPTIKNLEGIECLTELESLDLGCEEIGDISPISYLRKLVNLRLPSNYIIDIGPISNLGNLENVNFGGNGISDISPLGNLNNLSVIILDANPVGDINALEHLEKLEYLVLRYTSVTDLGPLENHSAVTSLDLSNNRVNFNLSYLKNMINIERLLLYDCDIEDISPLLDNTGLGEGDRLEIHGNPHFNCEEQATYIETLRERGVEVNDDCRLWNPDAGQD